MMRKWLIIPLLAISFLIAGCETNVVISDPILADDFINMENLDEYMFRDDVQYIDLRNYDARFRTGFIYSFEVIPFFDYLDYRAFDRNDSYEFNPDQILNEHELERLFDRDKAIFLFADGCIRSGYLKDVLNHLGYTRVFVLGGYFEYSGEHIIVGDGIYSIGNTFYSSFVDSNTSYTYYVYGTFEMGRKITTIRFDILDQDNISLRSPNYSDDIDFNEQLTIFEDFILSDIVTMNELHESLINMEENTYGDIPGLTWQIDDGIIQLIFGLYAY